jgi:hypothetical protein
MPLLLEYEHLLVSKVFVLLIKVSNLQHIASSSLLKEYLSLFNEDDLIVSASRSSVIFPYFIHGFSYVPYQGKLQYDHVVIYFVLHRCNNFI